MDQTTYMDVHTYENVYENYIEDKMEQDIVIPDYYCSARKIVNCQASVSDISKSISDDKIVIEGMCHWKIIYLSEEDDALHHISCEKRFCEYFSSGADNSNGSIRYKIKVKNTFCKLLSPQKAECKSLLCIAIQLKANQTKKLLASPTDPTVEVMAKKNRIYEHLTDAEAEFKVTGEIPYKFTDAYDIYKASSQVYINECNCAGQKIIIKGHCKNNVILLHRDTPEVQSLYADVPFTQVIESETVKDGDAACVRCNVAETEASYIGDGENSMILVSNHLTAEATVFSPKEIAVISDAYHPTSVIELKKESNEFCNNVCNFDIMARTSQKIHIDTANVSVLLCECDGEVEKVTAYDTAMSVDGKLNVCILYSKNNEITYGIYPMNLECRKTFDMSFEKLICDASVIIENMNYIILNETEIEISCEYRVSISAYFKNTFEVVSGLTVTDQKHDRCMETPLVIYYASKGESVWNIGKKYSVPIGILKENNELHDDVIENDQLIFITQH